MRLFSRPMLLPHHPLVQRQRRCCQRERSWPALRSWVSSHESKQQDHQGAILNHSCRPANQPPFSRLSHLHHPPLLWPDPLLRRRRLSVLWLQLPHGRQRHQLLTHQAIWVSLVRSCRPCPRAAPKMCQPTCRRLSGKNVIIYGTSCKTCIHDIPPWHPQHLPAADHCSGPQLRHMGQRYTSTHGQPKSHPCRRSVDSFILPCPLPRCRHGEHPTPRIARGKLPRQQVQHPATALLPLDPQINLAKDCIRPARVYHLKSSSPKVKPVQLLHKMPAQSVVFAAWAFLASRSLTSICTGT